MLISGMGCSMQTEKIWPFVLDGLEVQIVEGIVGE